jgi:hypothetical protein
MGIVGRVGDVNRKRYIHYCTGDKHVGNGINAFNPGPRGVLCFKLRLIVAKMAAGEATIILDGWVCGTGKTVRIQMVAVWFVVLFISWVVNKESIQGWGMTNNNAVHCVGLMLGVSSDLFATIQKAT